MFTFLFLYVCIVIAFNFLNLIQKKGIGAIIHPYLLIKSTITFLLLQW